MIFPRVGESVLNFYFFLVSAENEFNLPQINLPGSKRNHDEVEESEDCNKNSLKHANSNCEESKSSKKNDTKPPMKRIKYPSALKLIAILPGITNDEDSSDESDESSDIESVMQGSKYDLIGRKIKSKAEYEIIQKVASGN